MSSQSSTEFLLRDSSRLATHNNTEESLSTEALLHDNGVSSSTGSLVNESVQELLNRLNVQETSYVESDSPDITVLSPTLADAALVPEDNGSSSYEAEPLTYFERHEEVDPLLSLLYNKIQVFLLRNGMSLEFLRIYKRYIDCLCESGLNPLDDHYFLLLQNELSESYEFTPRMEEILNAFLLSPRNLIQKLALFEHRRMRNLLRRQFEKWVWYYDMRQSLYQLEHIWDEFVKRKYVLKWSKKHQVVIDIAIQAEEFEKFHIVSSSFDKWLTRVEIIDARKGLADHYVMDHSLQRLVKRMDYLRKSNQRACYEYDVKCQRVAFQQWRLRAFERIFKTRQLNLKRFCFDRALIKLRFCRDSEDRAAFTRKQLLVGSFFDVWRSRLNEEKERLDSLAVLEKRLVKTKTFKILVRSLKEKEKEVAVTKRLDAISIKFFFESIWKTRFRERLHCYSFRKITDERSLHKYNQLWQVRLFSRVKANNFLETNQVKKFLHIWRAQTRFSLYSRSGYQRRAQRLLILWHNRSIEEVRVRQFQHDAILLKYQHKWHEKASIIWKASQEANKRYELFLITGIFNRWFERSRMIIEMDGRSRIFMRLQAISLIKRGIAHMGDVRQLSEVYDPVLISKDVLRRFYLLWKKRSDIQRSDRLNSMGQVLEYDLQQKLQKVYLQVWSQRLKLYRLQCLPAAEQMYDRNLQLRFFLGICQRLENARALTTVGDTLRVNSLYLTYLSRWRDRFDNVQQLVVRLDTENNKKNLALLLNYLNFWSMRILKLKRNEETVQIFRKRWDRAAVRGLMLLWKNKVDNSPRKGRFSRGQHLASDNGLVTPVRSNARRKNTIPGSEGVKRYRIEAMKSHYGRIGRAIPSPVKSSTTLNSVAKKKIDSEGDGFAWNPRSMPPPRLSLERINKNLASKIDRINFERIPETRLDPFISADLESDPKVDTSFLEEGQGVEFDESPTRRT